MSDDLIFREVDEELRQEQLKSLWRRYGTYMVAVAVLIIAGVAGYKGWGWYQERQAAQSGARYEQALQLIASGEQEQAVSTLEGLARDGSGGYPVLARLVTAGAKAETGQRDAAIAEYEAIASQAETLLADLARVQAAMLAVDTESFDQISRRVGAIDTETNPWRNHAREALGLAAYRARDLEAAAGYFEAVVGDQQVPQELQRRAELMLSVVTPQLPSTAEPAQPAANGAAGGAQ